MPGRLATLRSCSSTFSSISRTSDSSAYKIPGTRMLPVGSMRQTDSDSLFSKLRSIAARPRSNVDDALREPRAVRALLDAQARQRRTFDLDDRPVLFDVDALADRRGFEARVLDFHLVPPEEHVARRHLVDHRIQEVGQDQLDIRRLAADLDPLRGIDVGGIRDDRR